MTDFDALRDLMVETQLIPRGIFDQRVLSALKKVPRHLFVSDTVAPVAYEDRALPLGLGQTVSQPYMVAIMTELLSLEGNERVLEIGTGSGYQTAVLAELSKEVFTIERLDALSSDASETLKSLGYTNVRFKSGDGTLGWPEEGPFDRILITAGAPKIPEPLVEQLSEGGIIVIPVGDSSSQNLIKAVKRGGRLAEEFHTPCTFVPLIGEFGWKEASR